MLNCKRQSSRPKSMDTVQRSISTKWAPATPTTLLRLSPLACPPPRRCEVQPNENSFIEPGRDGFVGSRGFNRQPPGRALRRGGAERVPRLRDALRRDHAAGARSFSGARLARQLQRRGRETASLFARARWPNESRRKLVGRAFARTLRLAGDQSRLFLPNRAIDSLGNRREFFQFTYPAHFCDGRS